MPTRTGRTQQVGVRLPHETIKRLDAYLVKLKAEIPRGFEVTRADAARVLIAEGLGREEQKDLMVPKELAEQVDAYLQHIQKVAPPGVTFTRTDAIKALMIEGLKHAQRTKAAK